MQYILRDAIPLFDFNPFYRINQNYPQMTINGAGGGPGAYFDAIRAKGCGISV